MESKFQIINFTKKLIAYLDNILINFPKREIELKKILVYETNDLLKRIYITNDMKESDNKLNNKIEVASRIKYISFIIDRCYDKKIITKKQYLNIGYMMSNLLKYVNGWVNKI